jgi:hypothetical protein
VPPDLLVLLELPDVFRPVVVIRTPFLSPDLPVQPFFFLLQMPQLGPGEYLVLLPVCEPFPCLLDRLLTQHLDLQGVHACLFARLPPVRSPPGHDALVQFLPLLLVHF